MANDPEPKITRAELSLAKAMNTKLLQMGAWCKVHHRGYAANHMVNGRIEGQGCPRCKEEGEWVAKARTELKAENLEITAKALLARAELLAGKILHRYKRHD